MIAEQGTGVLIYEQQEGRGIGLMAKLQAYELQDAGLDTVEANERLGFEADLSRVRTAGGNPEDLGCVQSAIAVKIIQTKLRRWRGGGIEVVERVPCEVTPSSHAEDYLKTKKEKMGHLFSR